MMDERTSKRRRSLNVDKEKFLQAISAHKRDRYSMNYNSYEAAIIDPTLKKLRMLEYTFPGYKVRSGAEYQEDATQTQVSIRTNLSEQLNTIMKDELNFEECIQETKEIKVPAETKQAEDLKADKNNRRSLAAHGWVGPPLIIKMRITDFLFIEITPVALPPVLLRLNKGAIDHHTLEISIVPGPQFVPQVVIMISGLEIYPDNKYKLLSVNKSLARRPTMFLNTRNTTVKSGGRWLGKKGGMQNAAMSECLIDKNQPEEEELEDEGFDMPQSWLKLHYDKLTKQKEYHLNKYKISKGTDTSLLSKQNPLRVIFESDYKPLNKYRMPKQMKDCHFENKLMYSKQFIGSPQAQNKNKGRISVTKAHAATSTFSIFRWMKPLSIVPSGEELEYIEANPKVTRGRRGTFYPQTEVLDSPLSDIKGSIDNKTIHNIMLKEKVEEFVKEKSEEIVREKSKEVVKEEVVEVRKDNHLFHRVSDGKKGSNVSTVSDQLQLSKISWTHAFLKKSKPKMQSKADRPSHILAEQSPSIHGRTTSEEYALARIKRYMHARGASPVSPSPHESQFNPFVLEEDKTVTDRLKDGMDLLDETMDNDRKILTSHHKSSLVDTNQKSLRYIESKEPMALPIRNKSVISEDGFKTATQMSEDEEKSNTLKTPRKKSTRQAQEKMLPTIKEESPALEKSPPKASFTNITLNIQKELSPIRDEIESLRGKMASMQRKENFSNDQVIAEEDKGLLKTSFHKESDRKSKYSNMSVFLESLSSNTPSIIGDENQPEKKKAKRFYERFTKKK